ncbi:MAG TPA: FISUMP domain-containing protein, partial [Draconibacterium sp.]|nr:FISUMP domain-containing protein [Draconibacterium sp.]
NYPAAKASCPAGWHIPSNEEWNALTNFLGGEVAAHRMKEAGYLHWLEVEQGAWTDNNESGFTALPGGYLLIAEKNVEHPLLNVFCCIHEIARFWSSNESGNNASYHSLHYDKTWMDYGNSEKDWGYSIRCIRDY